MISFIKGIIHSHSEENLYVEVGGIGYHVLIAPGGFANFPEPGQEIFLFTHLLVREDNWQLFGFPEQEQLEIFRLLISVSGVGAKLALTALNNISVQGVIQAVINEDVGCLSSIPGIGKKIAQRLVLELKEKLKNKTVNIALNSSERTLSEVTEDKNDIILALTQLGYSLQEAKFAAQKVMQELGEETNPSTMIKAALKILAK